MKITKEELVNIIKEEVETSLQEKDAKRFQKFSTEDYEQWAGDNNIPLMGVDIGGEIIMVPIAKPKLPKNWSNLPGRGKHPIRYWFRMWNKHSRGLPAQDKKDALDALKPAAPVDKISQVKDKPSRKKDAMAAVGYNPDGTPLVRKKRPGKKMPDLKVPKDHSKDGDGDFPFRDRSKPFKLKKEPRGPQKSSGVPSKSIPKGRAILINKAGRRTSLKTKDSRWKFRDGNTLPLYNYIPGRGQVDDEVGKAYYRFSLEENDNITMEEIKNIVEQEVEKALEEQERPSDDKVLDFIKYERSAKEIWNSLGEEEKVEISNIAQKASNELYTSGLPKWYVPFIMRDAFAAALEQTKGSVKIFSKSLRDQIKIARRN